MESIQFSSYRPAPAGCRWALLICLAFCAGISSSPLYARQLVPVDSRPQAAETGNESGEELFAIAAGFYSNQDWSAAIRNFTLLIERYPYDQQVTVARFYLGESRIQTGDFAGAIEAFEKFLVSAPAGELAVRARFRIAEARYLDGNRQQAVAELNRFVESHPDDALAEYALHYAGECLLEQGDAAAARERYQQALTRFAGSPMTDKCQLGLARAHRQLAQPQEADRFLLLVAGKKESELADDALLISARMWAAENEWTTARERLTRLQTEFPGSELRSQGKYLAARGAMAEEDWAEAWRQLEPLINERWPDDMAAAVLLDASLVAVRRGDFDRAVNLIERARPATTDATLAEFATALEIDIVNERGDGDRLEVLVNRFQADRPDSTYLPRAVELLARYHYSAGRYGQAAQRYGQLVGMAERMSGLHIHLATWRYLQALALIGHGEYRAAEIALEPITEFGGDKVFEGAWAFARATSLAGNGKFNAAIPDYRRYLELVPDGVDRVRCHADLATALVRDQQLDAAIAELEKILPDHGNDRAVLTACEFVAEAALAAQRQDVALKYFRMLAESSDAEFAKRGAAGSIWSGEENPAAEPAVQDLLQGGDEATLEALLARAIVHQNEKQFSEAQPLFEQVIAAAPNSTWACNARVRLAMTLLRSGGADNVNRAKALLDEFLATDRSDHPLADVAWYELAWVRHEAGEKEPASEAFLRIVREYPESKYWSDSLYRAATIAREAGNNDQAAELFYQLVQSRPEDRLVPYGRYALGEIAAHTGDWATAIGHFELVRQAGSETELAIPALFWIAECYYQKGQTAIAERHFQSLYDQPIANRGTKNTVVLRLAQCSARRDDWARVNEILNEAAGNAEIDSDNWQFEFLRARVLMSQAKFEDARQRLTKVLNDPAARATSSAAMSQWLIGESWFHQQQWEPALRAYLLVDTLYDWPQWRALALLQAAKCHQQLGSCESAIRTVERLLESMPDSDVTNDARRFLVRLRSEGGEAEPRNATFSTPER